MKGLRWVRAAVAVLAVASTTGAARVAAGGRVDAVPTAARGTAAAPAAVIPAAAPVAVPTAGVPLVDPTDARGAAARPAAGVPVAVPTAGVAVDAPTGTRGAAVRPVAGVPMAAPAAGAHAFERTNADGTPARWDPCRPVHYVVNASGGPADALGLVRTALQQVTAATGLHFVYDGPTTAITSSTRPVVAGGGWNPVLVSWETPGDSAFFPGQGEDGEGGFTAVRNRAGRWVIVSGQLALDRSASSFSDFQAEGGWSHLLLHEWGHVVGLDHVADRGEVMDPVSWPGAPTVYGPGDRFGLAELGATRGCLAQPATAGLS